MLALLARALQRSRPEAASETAKASQVELELLERRVQKLTAQLEETQELLARVRNEKADGEAGVPSIHRTVQGLTGGDRAVEQRRALMREISDIISSCGIHWPGRASRPGAAVRRAFDRPGRVAPA